MRFFARKKAEDLKHTVPASPEMREYFGFSEMAHPDDARQWFEGLFRRQPFATPAVEYFRTLRLEVGTLDGRCRCAAKLSVIISKLSVP